MIVFLLFLPYSGYLLHLTIYLLVSHLLWVQINLLFVLNKYFDTFFRNKN